MTEESTATASRIDRFSHSKRAMVPLAVIGVLLLLTSVMIVGYVETRDDPEPDVDATVALDQTEANTQAVVRDSSQRATEMAAREPMTAPSGTAWGGVLNGSADGLSDDPFENYLRALIYLEVADDLSLAGEQRGNVQTNVTLPAVTDATDFTDAVRRVNLADDGTELTVTLSNVSLTATYADEVIEERETTVDVTIVTPIMQLHDRVSEYQYAIDEAALTERGFTQRFNARTYAIGWARGWAQNYRAPVGEVMANRHIEPSANAALYRTQQDVFGAADPNLQNAVRLGWTCMGLKDGEALFDEYMDNRGGMSYGELQYDETSREFAYNDSFAVEVPEGATGGLCSGAHFLLDQAIEQHPPSPEIIDLAGGTNRLQENETVAVDETAYLPLVELVDPDFQYSFANATQQVFTIEGYVDAETTTTERLDFQLGCGYGYRGGSISRDGSYEVTTVDRSPIPTDNERYYRYESEIRVTVDAERTCYEQDGNGTRSKEDTDSYTTAVTTTVGEEEASPFVQIDDVNPGSEVASKYTYSPGPTGWRSPAFNNFAGAEDEVTAGIFGGTSLESHEQWLDSQVAQTEYEEGPPTQQEFETTTVVELDYERLLGEFKLESEMADAVTELQEAAANVTTEFERKELVTGNPTSLLLEEIETEIKAAYIDESDSYQYENVGEKALYEARYMYYLTLVEQLKALEDAHGEATAELDSQLTDADDALGNATQFLTQGIREEEATPEAFATSELTENISYEVSGSPTYLLSEETVDTDRVPPVDQDVEFAPLRAKNENAIDMPYQEVLTEILQRVLDLVPGLSGTPDAQITLRMAGDVLAGGELALEAHERAQENERNDTYLTDADRFEHDLEVFEENVAESIETFETTVAEQTVAGLYPSPATECLVYDDLGLDERYPGWQTCYSLVDEQLELKPLVNSATEAVETGVTDALAPYDTAEAALLIGNGNATEPIVENVTRQLDDAEYRTHDEFTDRYEDDQWADLINSAVRPAVTTASATSVEIGSVEQAEALDETIQGALGNATRELTEQRVEEVSEVIGDAVGERWLGNTKGNKHRAARVPAGLPLLPIPGKWIATANGWNIEVAGEYARFEVSANLGTPADGTEMTYVRENRSVSHEIAGEEREIGSVEEISFDSQTILVVITTPGVGVGDRDSENPECSPTYPHVGEVDPDEETDCTGRENPGDDDEL